MIEACFTGRLGRDAELRIVKGGELAMVSFSAVVEGKDEDPDAARWVRVVLFGDKAEQMAERLVKGTRVYVEGKLSAEIWQPENGPPRLNLNVTASIVVPMNQIGRRPPRQNATRRQSDRACDAQAPFYDDAELARADLEGRR